MYQSVWLNILSLWRTVRSVILIAWIKSKRLQRRQASANIYIKTMNVCWSSTSSSSSLSSMPEVNTILMCWSLFVYLPSTRRYANRWLSFTKHYCFKTAYCCIIAVFHRMFTFSFPFFFFCFLSRLRLYIRWTSTISVIGVLAAEECSTKRPALLFYCCFKCILLVCSNTKLNNCILWNFYGVERKVQRRKNDDWSDNEIYQ